MILLYKECEARSNPQLIQFVAHGIVCELKNYRCILVTLVIS